MSESVEISNMQRLTSICPTWPSNNLIIIPSNSQKSKRKVQRCHKTLITEVRYFWILFSRDHAKLQTPHAIYSHNWSVRFLLVGKSLIFSVSVSSQSSFLSVQSNKQSVQYIQCTMLIYFNQNEKVRQNVLKSLAKRKDYSVLYLFQCQKHNHIPSSQSSKVWEEPFVKCEGSL
jgi:hypothetical protein